MDLFFQFGQSEETQTPSSVTGLQGHRQAEAKAWGYTHNCVKLLPRMEFFSLASLMPGI